MLRIAKRKRSGISIHLTALIDMIFLLLIYFLLTSSFVEQEGLSVAVPRVSRSAEYLLDIPRVVVDGRGGFHFDNRLVSDNELAALLRPALAAGDGAVAITAERTVVYDRVVRALDIARQSGARQLNLTVEREEAK